MSLPPLDPITGCLLIGTWASSLLYMFEITQSLYYFQNFQKDNWKIKTLVTITLVIDTLGIIGDYICVYLVSVDLLYRRTWDYMTMQYTITNAGDAEYLVNVHWSLSLYGFTTAVLGVLVQTFLVFRYWRFTQNTLIALFLSSAMVISFGASLVCDIVPVLHTSLSDRPQLKIPVAIWLVAEFAVNAGIAAVLLWEFRKVRGFLKDTRSIIDRLIAVTIQSGAATATLAGAGLISYYVNPESNVAAGILYPLRRVYVMTLLSNLNIRKSEKSFFYMTGTLSGHGTTGGERELPTFARWAPEDSCAIHVHRPIHTSVQVIGDLNPRQDRPPETFKNSFRSATDDSREEIEMMARYSSKKQSTLSTA
ncbi:hypothetical protein C8R45DRAFT_1138000 [Mycena sanguinolenta]|nr:hypothetical protein C8R45DRAFT_1138000 [Mycena sanguinolenta]